MIRVKRCWAEGHSPWVPGAHEPRGSGGWTRRWEQLRWEQLRWGRRRGSRGPEGSSTESTPKLETSGSRSSTTVERQPSTSAGATVGGGGHRPHGWRAPRETPARRVAPGGCRRGVPHLPHPNPGGRATGRSCRRAAVCVVALAGRRLTADPDSVWRAWKRGLAPSLILPPDDLTFYKIPSFHHRARLATLALTTREP
jgi:hypothetical protein